MTASTGSGDHNTLIENPDPLAISTAKRDSGVAGHPIHLLPFSAIYREAEAFAEGAGKYGPHDWRKGRSWVETANHALHHIFRWLERDSSEDHLARARANLAFLCEYEETKPELDDRYKPS